MWSDNFHGPAPGFASLGLTSFTFLDGFKIYLEAPLDLKVNSLLYNHYKDGVAGQVIVNLGPSAFRRGHSLHTVCKCLPVAWRCYPRCDS